MRLMEADSHTSLVFYESMNTPLAKSTLKALAYSHHRGVIHLPRNMQAGAKEAMSEYLRTLLRHRQSGDLTDDVYDALDSVLRDYAESSRGRLLSPGCIRFVTVPESNPEMIRHTLLISGELVDHGAGAIDSRGVGMDLP